MAETPWLDDAAQAAQRYEEAAAVAVEACADDTRGQTCYICHGEGDEDEGLVRGCACRGDNGYAHLSCLARGAQAAVQRGVQNRGWTRWHTCGQCKQQYHGVVRCALGWACWKTYVGRPEVDCLRKSAITMLGSGLQAASHNEEALSVKEAEVSMARRIGARAEVLLAVQGNLACTYQKLGRNEQALNMFRDVYSGRLRLKGEEHKKTLSAANNYALSLLKAKRFADIKSLLRKMIPVAQRVLGESNDLTPKMRGCYAMALYRDPDATLDDLREAVSTVEDAERIARRVFGGAHPFMTGFEKAVRVSRAALGARETAPPPPPPPPPPAPLYDEDELE